MPTLKNKVALITGSTSGIGLGIAEVMAAEGYHIVLNGFGDAAEIESLRSRLASTYGVKVVYNGADMSKATEIEAMMTAAAAEFGGVDILVNNAGIQHVSPVEDFPTAKWDAIIAINMTSAFHTTKMVVPYMKSKGWGRIINIASAHALVASPFKSAYVAAKHGVIGFTKTVGLEVATFGITCNAICPGYVMTPIVRNQIADQARTRGISQDEVIKTVMLAAQPTKQFVTFDQLTGLLLYLVSDAGASANASSYSVDGGWTAQ